MVYRSRHSHRMAAGCLLSLQARLLISSTSPQRTETVTDALNTQFAIGMAGWARVSGGPLLDADAAFCGFKSIRLGFPLRAEMAVGRLAIELFARTIVESRSEEH